jgi:hypothetical protein
MNTLLGLLLSGACFLGDQPPGECGCSYLTSTTKAADGSVRVQVECYNPQPGDLVLFDEQSAFWQTIYFMVGTQAPDHAGIVVRAPNGDLVILESAPDDGELIGFKVGMLDLLPRLRQFQGRVYIRRIKTPLDPDHCRCLTEFAMAQVGKPYALGRFFLQATPFRCRYGLGAKFGGTYLDRTSWLCSELVVAAGTVAGRFDPHIHKANMIYPADLLGDKTYDLSELWHPSAVWSDPLRSRK